MDSREEKAATRAADRLYTAALQAHKTAQICDDHVSHGQRAAFQVFVHALPREFSTALPSSRNARSRFHSILNKPRHGILATILAGMETENTW
jgi:hypothetical protein